MNKELITIIVPIYNVQKYIEECVESIMQQTYTNLQILLIDDGSTDKCPELCDYYATQDNRIKVFHKDNGGVSDARNYGINKATGNYIMFIDSDDYIEKDFVQVLYEKLIEFDADISACGYRLLKNNKVIGKILDRKQCKDKLLEKSKDKIEELLVEKITGNYSWNKLFKKNLFEKIRYIKSIKFEDIEIMYRLFTKANRVVLTDYNGYYYRQREDSIMQILDKNSILNLKMVTNQRYNYVKKYIPALKNENIARKCYTVYRYHILLARRKNKELYYSDEMKDERIFFKENFRIFYKKLLNIKLYEKILLIILKINPKLFYLIVNIM